MDDRFSYVETAEAGLRIKLYAPGDAPLQEAIDWLWSTGFRPPSELTLKRKKQLDDGRVEYAFG